jgi:DNA-binding transcriptional MerR regulator
MVRRVRDGEMSIGAFSRATGLSPKALRSYDRLGLLSPARVDPDTRYRGYAPEQVERGQTIRALRELEVPLLEIRALLDASTSEETRERLLAHQRRLAFRSVVIQHALARLQALIEGKETLVNDVTVDPVDAATHRRLAVDLFNRSWRLLELGSRTPEQDDELVHVVHASRYHWGEVGTVANVARGENQCARAYAALGRGEPALYHAGRALAIVQAGGEGIEDWDLASALEVMARAQLAAGNRDDAGHFATLARSELESIADPDDREVIESQIDELGL